MEILLSIPESLKRYVEYIPEDLLPEVLIGLLRRGVFKPDIGNRMGVNLDDNLVSRLLTAIKDSSTISPKISRNDNTPEEGTPVEEAPDTTIQPTSKVVKPTLDCEDDLDDFLGLLK